MLNQFYFIPMHNDTQTPTSKPPCVDGLSEAIFAPISTNLKSPQLLYKNSWFEMHLAANLPSSGAVYFAKLTWFTKRCYTQKGALHMLQQVFGVLFYTFSRNALKGIHRAPRYRTKFRYVLEHRLDWNYDPANVQLYSLRS